MIKRPPRHQRNRTALTPANIPPGAFLTSTFSIVATKARIHFSAPIVLNGIPFEITRQAAGSGPQLAPTAVTVVDNQTIDLTYAASVVATDVITIPANVIEIRSVSGGQAAATAHTFP